MGWPGSDHISMYMSSSPWAGVSRYQILKQRRTISHIKVTTIGKRRLLGRWFKFYLYLHSLNGQTNNGIYSNIRPEERLTTTRACANQQEGGRSKDISWPEPDIALYHPTTRRLGLEAWLSIPFRSGSPFISRWTISLFSLILCSRNKNFTFLCSELLESVKSVL